MIWILHLHFTLTIDENQCEAIKLLNYLNKLYTSTPRDITLNVEPNIRIVYLIFDIC